MFYKASGGVPEYGFTSRTPLGSSVNRGNGAALSGDCPGIYERRGKDSNLRGLTPTLQLGHLRKPGPDRRQTFPRASMACPTASLRLVLLLRPKCSHMLLPPPCLWPFHYHPAL